MHVTWCSSLLSPPLFKGGIVIASARLSVCLSVRPSVCYALSSLIIGRNPTKFGVPDFHMRWGVQQHFFWQPPGAPRRVQRSTIIFEKSISMIFFIPNFMFVLKYNRRNGNFIMSPGSMKGMSSRTEYKINVPPMVKLVTLRYSQ